MNSGEASPYHRQVCELEDHSRMTVAHKGLHKLKPRNPTHDTPQAAALEAGAGDDAFDEENDGETDDDQSTEGTRK